MLQVVINILLVVHVLASLLLLLVVLMQRPKSEGLGAAFGGGMTEDLFGAQTTTVLTKITVYLGSAFFVLTLTLAVLYSMQSRQTTGLQRELAKPVEAAAPASAASPTESMPATEGEQAAIQTIEKSQSKAMQDASQESPAPTADNEATDGADANASAVQSSVEAAGDTSSSPAAPSTVEDGTYSEQPQPAPAQ